MCITSPPYWKLRDYKTEGQIGQESVMDWYLMNLVDIFTEVGRVLKPTGSLWINLGDTFNGSKKGNTNNKQKQGVNTKSFQKFPEQMIKEKSMLMIPERFAIIMLDYGWILRNKIIWHKPNAMPQSAPDRFTMDWEYLYHFTKNKKYYWEQQYRPLSESTMKEIQKMYTGQATKDYDTAGVQNPSDTKRRIIRGIRFGGDKADGYGRRTYSGKVWEPTIIKYGSRNITFKTKTGSKDDPNRGLHTGSWSDKKQARVRGPQPGTTHYNNAIKLGWNPDEQDYATWYFTQRQKKSWHDHSNDSERGFGHHRGQKPPRLDHPLGSKMRSMWSISTRSFPGAHFATFPVKLLETPIRASCPPNGICLDPFMGAGTTALAALQLNRQFVGIELSEEYVKMANQRIKPYVEQLKLEL